MSSITVLIRHSGTWNEDNCYIEYSVDGIVMKDYSSYVDLVGLISNQLGVDLNTKCIKIKYVIDDSNTPMEIHNDMGVQVYVQLKKSTMGFGLFPLCVTVVDKDVCYSVDGETSIQEDVMQLEYHHELIDTPNTFQRLDMVVADQGEDPNDGNCLIIANRNVKDVTVDQIYVDKSTLKAVMDKYAIDNRFQFLVQRSNSISLTLVCISKDCKWLMKASSINKSQMFRIRVFYDEHTCPLKDRIYSQRHATSGLIGGIITPKLRNHKRKYTPNDIIANMKMDLGVDVNYMMAWRAKERALDSLMGKPAKSYNKLPGYLYTLDRTYPGSHIRMKKTHENHFLYLFISLHAFIKGFDHCRPIVVVDASHLRGAYTGAFVAASTLDGAGNIFSLAYGVIDSENDAAWSWFIEQFKVAFGERENMCFVSDRNESIIKVVSKVYNNVPHYACIWHLWNNVCKNYKKSNKLLGEVFYSMAKAYTQAEFNMLMDKVEKVDIRVKKYLELAGYEKWARLYAPVNRGWIMTSNIAESINSTLVEAMQLHIFEFLEQVRLLFARWNCTNQQNASFTFKLLGNKFQEILTDNEKQSMCMTVVQSSDYIYSVSDEGKQYIVCLQNKKCSCRRFQVDEIPCAHAWAVLKSKNILPDEYCSDLYKPKTILKTYEVPVYPLPDITDWNMPDHISGEVVLPPKYKRPPGRPKKQRDKSYKEVKGKKSNNSCSTCGSFGHNRRTCRSAPRNK